MAVILNRPLSSLPEIGVPLDAADQHDAVAFKGAAVHERLDAFGRAAGGNHVQELTTGQSMVAS
jgi:hypothetical protein